MDYLNGFKTIIGVLITIAPLGASLVGYDTAPNFQGDASEFAAAAITLAGAVLALYGRMTATAPGWFAPKA